MTPTIEYEQETGGRWIAEILEISGALADGDTLEEAMGKVQGLALRVLADCLDTGSRLETCRDKLRRYDERRVDTHLCGAVRSLPGWADFVFSFHENEEIAPKMLSRIARRTGLQPTDL